MAIRLSGLTSGLDTDAIVQELVSAYSKKTEKYEKQQTKLTWKQDAWKSLNTKIYSLYTSVSNMRMSGNYNLKKTTVSDNTKATVTANSDAVTGTQRLSILQTAQASYITGGKLGDNVTSNTKMSELGYTDGNTSFEVKSKDGKTHEIKIQKDSTVKDVINQLKEAGLNASFDATNKRIFLSAKESGEANDFNLYADDANGNKVLTALGLNSALTTKDKDGNVIFSETGAAKYQAAYDLYQKAGADGVAAYVRAQVAEYKGLKEQYHEANVKGNTNKLLIAEYESLVAQKEAREAFENLKTAMPEGLLSDEQLYDLAAEFAGKDTSEITIDAIKEKLPETTLDDTQLQAIADVLGSEEQKENLSKVAAYKEKDKLVGADAKTVADLTTEIEGHDIEKYRADLAAAQATMKEVQTQIDAHEYKEFVENNKEDVALEAEIQKMVDLAEEAVNVLADPESAKGNAVKITGQDAIIELNGATFTSSSNSFSVNGITINAQAVTTDGPITITTNVDTQGIYDKIKDFLTEYNNVINEMTRLYNADSASDYEPLTDEEKEAMSDEQIEKWENKIKESLLRRDNSLNSVMSAMINSMAQSYEVDGQKLSLGSFGISTLGFLNSAKNEQYAFHIDGDEDDENTSGKKDKLMKAIEENPDQLMEFMSKLMGNLYESIDQKMKSTELSSAYKVYNDKEMDKEASRIEQMIKKWEEKISDQEDKYYKQFSQMEVALSKLQSQTSSISGLLGGGMQ